MTAYHLIGIGGAGMSVVAELLASRGAHVSGSDRASSAVTERLEASGITVFEGHAAENVPVGATVVVSSAIRESNPELAAARAAGVPILHRSQALALAAEGLDFVAVAGAHGKTTTSAMVAVVLREAGLDPSWAIGGSVLGLGSGAHLGSGTAFVAEADESDASFLNYRPRLALVTNIEPDHLDHYGSREAFEAAFERFAHQITANGLLLACADDAGAAALATATAGRVWSYGTGSAGPDNAALHVQLTVTGDRTGTLRAVAGRQAGAGEQELDGTEVSISLAMPGAHNLLNAAGAWAAAVELGADPQVAAAGLRAFAGTGRRYELRGEVGGVRVIDDYAHHPTEVAATVAAARHDVGEGRVLVLFQPHLYSRTREFADRFAQALAGADFAVVSNIYGSREDPIPGVTSELITDKLPGGEFVADMRDAAVRVAEEARPGDIVLTMGAGDVTTMAPVIIELLEAGGE